MIRFRRVVITALVVALPLAGACRKKADTEPPVATPSISFDHPRAPLGSPVEITYSFQVAPNAPAFSEDYRVMVHFLDSESELMWTDDHEPPVPTRQWKPGQKVTYTRTMFVPVFPYVGDAKVQMGLYSTKGGPRLPLAGEDNGQRAYRVGTLQLLPQTENLFLIFKDGWNASETAPDNSAVQWQWTKKVATIAFKNPKRDSVFYLNADNPGNTFKEPQTVQIVLNGTPIDSVTLTPRQEILRKTPLPADKLGPGEMAEIRLLVDKTFVPALLPAANNRDSRELGIRVFHAFVAPR